MGRVWYTTREEVQDAFDVREAAHRSAQIDNAIASASDDIDGWLNRHKHGLAPRIATRYFDWPSRQYGSPYRVWFEENEVVEIDSLTAGGILLVENTDFFLEPVNSGPPYTFAEINLNSGASFTNSGTHQRAIAIVGTWGINDDRKFVGTTTEALDVSETALDVSNAATVGVGSVLTIDDEKLLVTGRTAVLTASVLPAALTAFNADRQIAGLGASFAVGEILLVGSERMRVIENNGTDLTVLRGYDGSVLAAHSLGATISSFRTVTVERGALGTTAATHSDGSDIEVWDVPSLVRDLCRAEAITRLEQEFSAYGARVYSDEAERDSSGTEVVAGRGLTDIRKACARRYKRKFRKRAI